MGSQQQQHRFPFSSAAAQRVIADDARALIEAATYLEDAILSTGLAATYVGDTGALQDLSLALGCLQRVAAGVKERLGGEG